MARWSVTWNIFSISRNCLVILFIQWLWFFCLKQKKTISCHHSLINVSNILDICLPRENKNFKIVSSDRKEWNSRPKNQLSGKTEGTGLLQQTFEKNRAAAVELAIALCATCRFFKIVPKKITFLYEFSILCHFAAKKLPFTLYNI